MDHYLKDVQCLDVKGQELENCVLAQYCMISKSFQKDVLEEIMEFKNLKEILNKKQSPPYSNLTDFCFAFCSNEKGQNYC